MITFFNSLGIAGTGSGGTEDPVCQEGTGRLVPTLFIGQSNMAFRTFANDIVIPSGVAEFWKGTRLSGEVVDFSLLPSIADGGTEYTRKDEGTLVPAFVKYFYELSGDKISGVKYPQGATTYGNWLEDFGISGNHWSDVLSSGQYPVYQSCIDTADLYLAAKGLTRNDLEYIVMYLGESDAQRVSTSERKAKSLADLYDLVDRFHTEFPNAIFNVVETSYPSNQNGYGATSVRDNQRTVAANRDFVRIVDNLSYTIPTEQTEDGLHLLPIANNGIGQRAATNIRTLDYCSL